MKIYDNIFRTLSEKNTKLLIPIINEVFSTNYKITDKLDLLSGEHHLLTNAESDELQEVVTDSCIRVQDKLYHIECQSHPDGSMVLRMVEYDFCIALEHATKNGNIYEMEFPQSAVLYLRHTSNTPDEMEMKVNFPNGKSIIYSVPIVKVQMYSKEDVVNKQLYFLIPYYILRYENQKDTLGKESLIHEYEELYAGMRRAYELGILEEYDMSNIIQFTNDLVEYVFKDNAEVTEGVTTVMGGQVLETYADIIEKTGRAEGRAEGRTEGRTEGRIEGQVLAYKDVGLSDAEIAQKTNISVEEVARILKEA